MVTWQRRKAGNVCKSIAGGYMSERVKTLLSQMSLKEKIGQLHQTGSTMVSALPGIEADIDRWVTEMLEGRMSQDEFGRRMAMCKEDLRLDMLEKGEIGSFVNLYDDEKVAQVLEASGNNPSGIPVFIGVDVIRGYRTIYPTPLAMSCTFDMDLIWKMTKIAKKEAVACGVNWVFGPMLDVARDGRWGRIVESPGEDPYLASRIAETIVMAFQEEDEDGKLLATAKHFVAYGAVSGGQDYNTVSLSKQQLYDVYLPPFRAAVDAGVGAVMSAFHDLNGIPCTCDKWLLTDLLRRELGFDGFVVSDAEAVKQCVVHGVAEDEKDAARISLLAGGDMDMSSWDYHCHLEALLEEGAISIEDIDRAAERILEKKEEYGILDHTYQYEPEKIRNTVLSDSHRKAARTAAEEVAVLLKNDGTLPIAPSCKNIAVVGALAESKEDLMGPWAFTGNKDTVITVTEGLRNYVEEDVKINWVKGFDTSDDESGFGEALQICQEADFIIAVAGETAFMSGEAASRADLDLAGAQEKFLLKAAQLGIPMAVVLVNGRPLTVGRIQNNDGVGAILEAWHMGVEAGNAIAELLLGKANPCGKLTVTFPNAAGQEPMYYNHPSTGKPGGEFKFTSKYQDVSVKPLYPFGHGLSYTDFVCESITIAAPVITKEDNLRCSVRVKNVGCRAGKTIVQLYVHDQKASLARPVRELKSFQKICLRPGEAQILTFMVKAKELGFYDREGKYVIEPGVFDLALGLDSTCPFTETFTITD